MSNLLTLLTEFSNMLSTKVIIVITEKFNGNLFMLPFWTHIARSYYSIFDMGEKRVGFAKAKPPQE